MVEGDLDFPLLFADPAWDVMLRISNAAARAAGMPSTPMAKTIADTRAWDVSRGEPTLVGGLSEQEETDALQHAGH